MSGTSFELTKSLVAEALSAWLGAAPTVLGIELLDRSDHMLGADITYGEEEKRVILKIAPDPHDLQIGAEFARIQFMREATQFPLPQGHYCDLSGTVIPHSYAIYSRLEGVRLIEAPTLSPGAREGLDRQMGRAVALLHKYRAPRFGSIGEALPPDAQDAPEATEWWLWFQQLTLQRLEAARATQLLDEQTLERAKILARHFRTIFATRTKPTLIHGNIWNGSIVVDVDDHGAAQLSGFIDPVGIFAHPEMELANLDLWQTVGPAFFEEYREAHEIEDGYARRKFIYWVSALLNQVALYGKKEYAAAAKTLVDQVWTALGGLRG